jgi:hypothetical protein
MSAKISHKFATSTAQMDLTRRTLLRDLCDVSPQQEPAIHTLKNLQELKTGPSQCRPSVKTYTAGKRDIAQRTWSGRISQEFDRLPILFFPATCRELRGKLHPRISSWHLDSDVCLTGFLTDDDHPREKPHWLFTSQMKLCTWTTVAVPGLQGCGECTGTSATSYCGHSPSGPIYVHVTSWTSLDASAHVGVLDYSCQG